jgi:hypothetical protein
MRFVALQRRARVSRRLSRAFGGKIPGDDGMRFIFILV